MRIPHFVIDARLYQGGTTAVYAGVREGDGLPIAAKKVRGGTVALREELTFLRAAASRGVVRALDVVESDEGPVLLLERFGDQNLRHALQDGPVPLRRALRIALDLAQALAAVHERRIVHRDLKPENILHDSATDQVVIADFGIAAALPVGERALRVCDLVGTPSYVSPEQTGRMQDGCDFRSDLYSLGITLYELVTGKLPFAAQDLLELMSCHLSKLPEPPERHVPDLPPALSGIIMKLLAKRPADRYQSARGLFADLKRCAETLQTDGRIPDFALGRCDLVRPRAPEKAFGRETELEVLREALEQGSGGKPTLVLLSGREGAGRRELVRAMLRSQPRSHAALGAWSAGSDRPLAALSDALSAMAGSLLLLDDEQLGAIRRTLLESMGGVGQALIDLAPSLGDLLGPQPELPEVGMVEARIRLRHAFRRFIAGLSKDQVVVLSLSHFEHADAASASVLEALLDPGSRVLLILSAADATCFGALAERPGAVRLELSGLSVAAVTDWLAAALELPTDGVAELARVLHDKSAGHPGLVTSLLEHWVETGLIERSDGAFTWSIERVRAAETPKSLAALVSQRVAELPQVAQRVLAGLSCTTHACDVETLSAMTELGSEELVVVLSSLQREGLAVLSPDGYRIAHAAIADAARANVEADVQTRLMARLAGHWLSSTPDAALPERALRIAHALRHGRPELTGSARTRAARVYALAGARATAGMAYDTAAACFELGSELLGADGFAAERALAFELSIGLGRSLMMLGQTERAENVLKALCARELTPAELGVVYPSRCDNHSAAADRAAAVAVGIEGLARVGVRLPPNPSALKALPLLFSNQRKLGKLTHADHVKRPPATDPRALAALRILSTMTVPTFLIRRTQLYLLLVETAIDLILRYGHVPQTSGFLCTHASVLMAGFGKHQAARVSYEACMALERERPAPALYGRTTLVLYYQTHSWLGSWRESVPELAQGIERSMNAGDPLFAAMCASGAVTMQAMCGTPFDKLAECLESWASILNAERALAGSTANVSRLVNKFRSGEPIVPEDLAPITNFPVEAGPMRNNPMVNFGLAVAVVGHETQVRSWLDAIRPTFHKVNFGQPQVANLWLLDGLFAAKDARCGQPKRLRDAKRIVQLMRGVVQKTRAPNLEPIIALLEAEIMRATGDLERAAGLYVHAVQRARALEFHHLVAFAMEQRAEMLQQLGAADEAALFYREAALAYQRWGHLTKVRELETAHPELKVFDFGGQGDGEQASLSTVHHRTAGQHTLHQPARGRSRSTLQASSTRTLNAALDLSTVLNVSQEISTQLSGSGVVRAVLSGIAQNAGAERVLFVLRADNGLERVYAEFRDGAYHEIDQPLSEYDQAPHSLMRLLRRTHKPVVIADATADAGHASDRFVVESRCRSLAGVPVLKQNVVIGFVVLENRLVAGAFTQELVELTRALVAQAAISLDNASLYENMELRVRERTAELHARNAELRLVLDNVAQGLVTLDRDGRLASERSAIFDEWFPEGLPETVRGLFARDSKSVALFELGWEQLLEGILPLELCVEQMPKQLVRGERTFELGWRPIVDEPGELCRMLLVMSDVTEARQRQRSEQEQRQLMALVERVGHDRNGVFEFVRESQVLIRQLEREHPDRDLERRLVHTLKGNCGMFGVSVVSALCHDIESALELDQRALTADERAQLRDAWSDVERRLRPFLDMKTSTVQVMQRDYEAALRQLQRDNHPVAQELETWALEPLELRFQRVGEQAERLAQRFGKGALCVRNEHGGFRLAGDAWPAFWAAFAHAVRNAVDHGLEANDERRAAGKGAPTVTLRAYASGARFILEFSDDGRGIAWDRIRAKALLAGLPADTREELVAALFVGGISSKDTTDELSGRGIGMAALRQACVALGGEISVESAPGQGTTWRFDFPGELARQPRERRPSVRPSVAPAN